MVTQQNTESYNPAEHMLSVVDFFERVDKKSGGDGMVWAKATAAKGAQVIIELKTAHGGRVKIPPIRPGDPVCLSKYATFELLRDAEDLRQAAVNGLVRLLTHTEASAIFAKKAARLKMSPAALMEQSARETAQQLRMKPLDPNEVDTSQQIPTTFVSIEDAVNPRLHHLCAQVHPMLKNNQRMPVSELMSEISDLEDVLTLDDWEFLRSSGYYPTVKKFAEQKQAELARASGVNLETDDLS